jgi:polysaccharide chain length determinant protein (PEP-CTERM system associated)
MLRGARTKMANTGKFFDIHSYFKMGLRRKWYIIIPFMLSVALSFGAYKYMPKMYKATTVILVQAQKIPESYVRPTLTESVGERLNTISQEILSRTRLEWVINEFNLYPDLLSKLHMEEIVDMMKTKIEVKVQRQNAFSISFEGTDPGTVMKVTNKLASMFIEENLKFRESRVGGTAEFISKELEAAQSNLKKKEDTVRRFKEKNMGQLPEQLEANLRILERLQQQFKTTSDNLSAAEDRIVLLQNQIEQVMDRQSGGGFSSRTLTTRRSLTQAESAQLESKGEQSLAAQLNGLKKDLANAEFKYTESHPDVVELKRKIAALEPRVRKQEEERERRLRELREREEETAADSNSQAPLTFLDPAAQRLITQYKAQFKEAQLEAKRLKEEMGSLREQIALFQRRIEETPKREQEMVQINRDYELLRTYYQSLVDKKYQSQMAENLERKQQGEQFRILDPARLPEKPYKPDRNKVLALGAFFGLAIGLGLAWLRESVDRSFYEVSDLEAYLGIPVLATILNVNEEEKKAA